MPRNLSPAHRYTACTRQADRPNGTYVYITYLITWNKKCWLIALTLYIRPHPITLHFRPGSGGWTGNLAMDICSLFLGNGFFTFNNPKSCLLRIVKLSGNQICVTGVTNVLFGMYLRRLRVPATMSRTRLEIKTLRLLEFCIVIIVMSLKIFIFSYPLY